MCPNIWASILYFVRNLTFVIMWSEFFVWKLIKIRINEYLLNNLFISDEKLKMAAVQLSVPEQQISQFLADLLNLEAIEVGFNCFLTHRPDLNRANEVLIQTE